MKTFIIISLMISWSYHSFGQGLLGNIEHSTITPRKGAPISGYAGGKRRVIPWDIFRRYKYTTFFKPYKGVLDHLRAKAMILKNSNQQFLILSIDLVGTIDHFKKHLLPHIQKFGFTEDNIIITSTHTHSGPGALTYNKLWELFAMDRFNKRIYSRFIARLVKLVEKTYDGLTPVQLFTHHFDVPGIQRNRAKRKGEFDSMANALYLKNSIDDSWLGGVVNFAIHPTALGQSNRAYSADIAGSIERKMQEAFKELNPNNKKTSFMLLNGALGDVSPTAGGVEGMEKIAKIFTTKAISNLDNISEVNPTWKLKSKEVKLGRPGLSVYHCSKNNFLGKLIRWTRFFRSKRWRISKSLPKKINVKQLELGPILMMFWPGEPIARFGLRLKEYSKEKYQFPWTVSLAENHLAYFVDKKAELKGTREACTSFYSYKASNRIIDAHKALQR